MEKTTIEWRTELRNELKNLYNLILREIGLSFLFKNEILIKKIEYPEPQEEEYRRFIKIMDDITKTKYRISVIKLPAQYHEHFRMFWRRAVNMCSCVDYGYYNCARVELTMDNDVKAITVVYWPNLETY